MGYAAGIFLFLYYNIFFYFYQAAAGAIKITVLKELPAIIFYNKICQKSISVEKLSKEVFFTRCSSFWTNPARAKLEGESSKFWCGKSYMRALVPGAPVQVGMRFDRIWGRDDRVVAGARRFRDFFAFLRGRSCYEKICIWG